MVTALLFQPLPLAAGEGVGVIVNGAASTLSVTLVEVVFPALSTAVPLNC